MSIDRSSDLPFVSVIVPHLDQLADLQRCLISLENQSLSRSKYEVLVADNGSRDSLVELKNEFPDVTFLHVHERGAACARNAGMAAARGEVFAFTDADCIADESWLETGVNALAKADLIGGKIKVTAQVPGCETAVELFERAFAFRQETYINRKQFSVTANLFVTRDVARQIGSFKKGVAEDLDWCHRAAALGFRLAFNDTSIISHPARRDWAALTAKWRRLVRERWNGFEGKGLIRWFKWIGLVLATVLSIVPHSLVVFFGNRVQGFRERSSVVLVLARIRLWRAREMIALLQHA